MSLRYRQFERTVSYECPRFESALLARTTQRYVGLSKALAQQGVPYVVSMYGLPRTVGADQILTSIAWYPADCDVPWRWLQ